MDKVKEFLATGTFKEVAPDYALVVKGLERLGEVGYLRSCKACDIIPSTSAKLLQMTRGRVQFHFCRVCAFTLRDAVELFYDHYKQMMRRK